MAAAALTKLLCILLQWRWLRNCKITRYCFVLSSSQINYTSSTKLSSLTSMAKGPKMSSFLPDADAPPPSRRSSDEEFVLPAASPLRIASFICRLPLNSTRPQKES